MATGNGAEPDLGMVMDVLARMEAKIDRLNERIGGLEDGQDALTARVGNVDDNLLRVREIADLARKGADQTLQLVDTKLGLLRIDMLQAVDIGTKLEKW
jgi:predicted  nucleic acid-binding Zn-ribbon protein